MALYINLFKILRYYSSNKIINLDKTDLPRKNLSLDELFVHYNCDKGSSSTEGKKFQPTIIQSIMKTFIAFKTEKILEIGREGKGIASFYFYFPFSNYRCKYKPISDEI